MSTLISHNIARIRDMINSKSNYLVIGGAEKFKKHYAIINIVNGVTTQIYTSTTTDFDVGDVVELSQISGFTQGNGASASILSKTNNSIELDLDSSLFNLYSFGGVISKEFELFDEKQITTRDIVSAARIQSNDIRFGIEVSVFTSNKKYEAYDPSKNKKDYIDKHYCTVNNVIYLCLASGASVASVTPNQDHLYTYTDGYTWLPIGLIDAADNTKFGTTSHFPVKYNEKIDIQPGQILAIDVKNPGSLYETGDTVVISGDGDKAVAYINLFGNGGTILSMRVDNTGIGYSWAVVHIRNVSGTTTGVDGDFKVFLSDYIANKSISDILYANAALINTSIDGSENGIMYINGDIRFFGLVQINSKLDYIDTRSSIFLTSSDHNFQIGDKIVGQLSLANAIITGVSGNIIKYSNHYGKRFLKGEVIKSIQDHGVIDKVEIFDMTKINDTQILMSAYDTPVVRSENQVDEYKITIGF